MIQLQQAILNLSAQFDALVSAQRFPNTREFKSLLSQTDLNSALAMSRSVITLLRKRNFINARVKEAIHIERSLRIPFDMADWISRVFKCLLHVYFKGHQKLFKV